MADEQKRKLEIPWATLLPIVAALAGIVAQYKPLVSTRPATPSSKVTERNADQDVDARLWQDPLAVVQKAKAQLEEAQAKAPISKRDSHSLSSFAAHIKEADADTENEVLLLPVMLDSGPYLEQAESRLRARQAVMEALSESNFIPVDGEHIGFVSEKHWLAVVESQTSAPVQSETFVPAVRDEGPLFFAWEECFRDARRKEAKENAGKENNFDRVFVLWLPASRFNPYPLRTVTELLRGLGDKFAARVIGPATSNGLQELIEEFKAGRTIEVFEDFDYGQTLDKVKFYSARATASDESLAGHPFAEGDSLEDAIQKGVVANGWASKNFEFRRTILPDDEVLKALVDELNLRHVHVGAWNAGRTGWRNGDHIVILSEWDSAYGRALAKTFRDEAERAQPQDRPPDRGPRIDAYRYMHGLDGRAPSDSSKNESQDDSAKNKDSSSSGSGEATEGSNQSDFLRRLAKSLRRQEQTWKNKGEGGIQAFGVLGSDIYDKLMVLRALRPIFPNAVFFTNNYDAHFERREDWDDVHNLVVASPFGGALQPPWQMALAPFRDNNQTSMYAATLMALGTITKIDDVVRPPHLFEVGRNGAQELVVPSPTPSPSKVQSAPTSPSIASPEPDLMPRDGYSAWMRAPGTRTALAMAGVGLLLLGGWIALSVVDRRVIGGGGFMQRLQRAGSNTAVWLLVGVPLIVFGVAAYAVSDGAALEPLNFFSGISIWPTEMLRLIALLLAIHFLIKAHVDLDSNEDTLAGRFLLPGLPKGNWHWRNWHWRNMRLGLQRWHKEHPDWIKEDAEFTVKDAWTAYLHRNQAWPRFVRVGILVAIYTLFTFGVFGLFPQPTVPARGDVALTADTRVIMPAVFGMMILTFYVVDAIRLNSNFIRIVTGGVMKWEPKISVGGERIPPLTEADLARYYDIAFVAERTEVVARLIWYPLIVLAVMIMARSDYFDNWTWPYSLLLILCLNALWAFGAAAFLRRAAEQLRREAISKLQVLRVASYNDPPRRQMFEELVDEIRALKTGAFAPLSEQPFIRAIILPSGGLGLLAVGQRLLEMF
jgi:hypothetical protein